MTASMLEWTSGVTGTLVAREQLVNSQRETMLGLIGRHFHGVTRQAFEADLEGKNWVLLLHDSQGRLVGFSTLCVYESDFDAKPVSVVYSGDTIVDPCAWHTAALPREWIKGVMGLRKLYPRGRFYWLLITSGFRTYRLMPTFWQEFVPRHDARAQDEHMRLMRHLAEARFGKRYDPRTGIVRLEQAQVLAQHLAGIPRERREDPHVAFFERQNPGHAEGDEMVCLTEISEENLTRAGERVVHGRAQRGIQPGA